MSWRRPVHTKHCSYATASNHVSELRVRSCGFRPNDIIGFGSRRRFHICLLSYLQTWLRHGFKTKAEHEQGAPDIPAFKTRYLPKYLLKAGSPRVDHDQPSVSESPYMIMS